LDFGAQAVVERGSGEFRRTGEVIGEDDDAPGGTE
jgi:hypothetical protein